MLFQCLFLNTLTHCDNLFNTRQAKLTKCSGKATLVLTLSYWFLQCATFLVHGMDICIFLFSFGRGGGTQMHQIATVLYFKTHGTCFLLKTGTLSLNLVQNAFLPVTHSSDAECFLHFFGKYSPLWLKRRSWKVVSWFESLSAVVNPVQRWTCGRQTVFKHFLNQAVKWWRHLVTSGSCGTTALITTMGFCTKVYLNIWLHIHEIFSLHFL